MAHTVSFTQDTVTIDGITQAAGYSVTPSGKVCMFTELDSKRTRITFVQGQEHYEAALAAAKAANDSTGPADQTGTDTTNHEPEQPEPMPTDKPTAHDMNSMRTYRTGQTTEAYRREVDRAAQLAADQAARKPDYADEIAALLDRYARKLADWYNEHSRIEAMCPSVMIAGPANFPVRKKEKQNARREAHQRQYQEIQGLLRRMESIGTGGIQSDDARAVEKLTEKLAELEEAQVLMKAVNAFYRKHKTLEGCPGLSGHVAAQIKASMGRSWRKDPVPFEGWALSNNNANIRRTRERLDELTRRKALATAERETDIEGVKVIEDTTLMRVQIVFNGKPEPEVRDLLKRNGFRWAPSQGAWQRQLNNNGIYAAKAVLKELAAR